MPRLHDRALLLMSLCTTILATPPARAQGDSIPPAFTAREAFVGLSVQDIQASERWYREKLGLRVVMRNPRTDATRAHMVLLRGNGFTVELVQQDESVPLSSVVGQGRGALYVHGIFKVGIVVDDFDAAMRTLRARGVDIPIGPFPKRGDQPANAIIRDNAGNYIQLFGR